MQGVSATLQAFTAIPDCPAPLPGAPSSCPPFPYTIGACDTVQWSFGDGSTLSEIGSPFVTHTYANPGLYQVTLHISNALGVADQAGSVYVTRIPATVVSVQPSYEVNERDGSLAVHVTRSGDLSLANSVDWKLVPDTATAVIGAASGTLRFFPGEADQILTIPIFRDHLYYGGYLASLYFTLSPDGEMAGLTGWDAQHMYAQVIIDEADPAPIATIHDVSVSKTASSVHVPIDLTGTFAAPCCRAWTGWQAIDGTAHFGVDYGQGSGGTPVPPATTRFYLEIPLKANPTPGTRTFDVQLQNANFPLARSRATVTIVDDISAIVAEPAQLSIVAGASAGVTLSVANPRTEDVTVNVTSSDPTVASVSSPVVIPAGGHATLLVHALKPGHPTISISPAGGTPAFVEVEVVFGRRRAVSR